MIETFLHHFFLKNICFSSKHEYLIKVAVTVTVNLLVGIVFTSYYSMKKKGISYVYSSFFQEWFRNNLSNGLSYPLYIDRVVFGSPLSKYMIFCCPQRWFLPLAMCFWHHLCVLLVTLSLGCTEQLCHGAHSWINPCSQLWHGLWALHKAAFWEPHTKKGFFSVALSYQHWKQQQPDWDFFNFFFFFFPVAALTKCKEKRE